MGRQQDPRNSPEWLAEIASEEARLESFQKKKGEKAIRSLLSGPCTAPPGSSHKIAFMSFRLRFQMDLHNPLDFEARTRFEPLASHAASEDRRIHRRRS